MTPLPPSVVVIDLLTAVIVGLIGARFYATAARSRFNVGLIGSLMLVAIVGAVSWRYELSDYRLVISVVFWGGLFLYVFGTLLWLALRLAAKVRNTEPPIAFGHDDIQVRIMTIDAEISFKRQLMPCRRQSLIGMLSPNLQSTSMVPRSTSSQTTE